MNSFRKILIVTEVLPPKYGGADIAAFRYAQYLYKEKKMEVILLGEWNSTVDNEIKNFPFIQSIKIPKWYTKNWRLKRLSELYNWWMAKREVKKWMNKNKHKFDVLHSFNSWSNLNLAAVEVAGQSGKKVITETCLIGADDPKTLFKEKPKYKWSAQYYRKQAYLNADCFVSKSGYMTTVFEGLVPEMKVVEIPYFVNTNLFHHSSLEEKIRIRTNFDISPNDIVVLFVGAIIKRKGVIHLLDAISHLKNPNLHLILVGPYFNEIDYNDIIGKKIAANKKKVTHINSNVSNVFTYMKMADIYCLPSFAEGFPISIIEAQCSGLVVLASDLREIKNAQIQNGKNGFLFKTGDQKDLEHQLVSIIENIDSLDEFKTTVSKEAHNKYSIEVIADKYQQIYKSL